MINRTMAAIFAAGALVLTGCSQNADSDPAAADADAPQCPVEVAEAWVKAEEGQMTGAFGTLTNTGAGEVVITGGTSASATMIELHEVVGTGADARMQPKAGGFAIPPGEQLTLQPGGLHIMLMGLTEPIEPGAEVSVTLTCDNGATAPYTALAKEFTGAPERYEPGMDPAGSPMPSDPMAGSADSGGDSDKGGDSGMGGDNG